MLIWVALPHQFNGCIVLIFCLKSYCRINRTCLIFHSSTYSFDDYQYRLFPTFTNSCSSSDMC